jgi:hypothetical protein
MPKYNHIENIPAKVFFDVLKTKDFQQLKPKPREKDLDKVFMSIYDDYFLRLNNDKAKEYLELSKQLMLNAYKIDILRKALAFHYYNQTTIKMRAEFIIAVKEGYDIEINPALPFRDEVKRILDIDIGLMENEVAIIQGQMKEMKMDSGEEMNFYSEMTEMANILQGNTLIKEDMTLAIFVALRNSINRKMEKA